MNVQTVRAKEARYKSGKRLRVLDLFAGCGGMSLGFQAAGFEISAALEVDKAAAETHAANFHDSDSKHSTARDITETRASQFVAHLGLGKPSSAFDVIIGGPPCQAFARVGRSKLREVADHPEAFRHDPRARLYSEYLEYVEECAPLAIVMENVPDMLNHAGHNLADEICEVLDHRGYDCQYTLLNAAFYGVPQMRERMFLVATHKLLNARFAFPEPQNWIQLPRGYEGSRSVALRTLGDLFSRQSARWYRETPKSNEGLPNAISARQAIGDLPPIFAREALAAGHLKRGTRRLDERLPYGGDTLASKYATKMRNWRGFRGNPILQDHVIRYLPRDYKLFARLPNGCQYPEAHLVATRMFEEQLALRAKEGEYIEPDSDAWHELRSEFVPPYDPGKFPNKWRKMEADKPSRTLMAHLGKDSYSHIHYDSDQARTISIREAARLQSFPDGFRFCGTMNPAFRQIGNAVPPLMSKAIASSLAAALNVSTVKPRILEEAV